MGKNTGMIVAKETGQSTTISIQNLIYIVRGKQVMLDSDLACLYQVETKYLNRCMKRNEKRFPSDFCFQLRKEEYENLRCQFGTSNGQTENYGGRRYMPYVYTEQGIAMLSAVLRSDIAIQVSIQIMQTFIEMRQYMANTYVMYERMNAMEIRQMALEERTDARFEQVFDYISSHKEENQKIFFEGQVYDAFGLLVNMVQKAEAAIVVIDGYVDVVTLNILAKKNSGVAVTIYTLPSTKLTKQDITTFNTQYPHLDVRQTTAFHDRFLIIDEKEGYHLGASLKDAGKKCFALNHIEDEHLLSDLLDKARNSVGQSV